MIRWILLAWLFPVFILLYFYAATKSLWFHTHFPPHRQRMARAALCMEAAAHWSDIYVTSRFVRQAYRLCEDCGCPPDLWPADVLRVHVGVT